MIASRFIAIVAAAVLNLAAAGADEPPEAGASCPYDFTGEMPPGRFCVYRGVAQSAAGAVCSEDLVVIWSLQRAPLQRAGAADTEPDSSISFGFVNRDLLVLHGIAAGTARALLTEYSRDADRERTPLDGGVATLVSRPSGPETLKMTVVPEIVVDSELDECMLGSYRGAFVGVLRKPARDADAPDGGTAAAAQRS